MIEKVKVKFNKLDHEQQANFESGTCPFCYSTRWIAVEEKHTCATCGAVECVKWVKRRNFWQWLKGWL